MVELITFLHTTLSQIFKTLFSLYISSPMRFNYRRWKYISQETHILLLRSSMKFSAWAVLIFSLSHTKAPKTTSFLHVYHLKYFAWFGTICKI